MTREEFVRFYLPWNDQHGRRLGDDLDALIAAAREEQRAVDLAAHDACNSDCSNPYKCLCSNSSGSRIRRASLTATPLADRISDLLMEVGEAALVSEQQDKVLGEQADRIRELEKDCVQGNRRIKELEAGIEEQHTQLTGLWEERDAALARVKELEELCEGFLCQIHAHEADSEDEHAGCITDAGEKLEALGFKGCR